MDEKKLEEINLRLKQLVALKYLEAIHESYNILPDEEEWEIERDLEEDIKDRYRAELKEATEELDELLYGDES